MRRSRQAQPPGDVRLLAACSHLGAYFGFSLVAWMEIGREIFPGRPQEWSTGAIAAAGMVILFGPPAAALRAARSSPWRGFLHSHGSRALLFHSAALLGVMILHFVPDDSLSALVTVGVMLIAITGMLAWLVLPVGAAFRAKDGDLAWYPFVRRLLPDPPAEGWRTPLP